MAISVCVLMGVFASSEVVEFSSRKYYLSGFSGTLLMLASCVLVFLAAIANPTGIVARVSIFLGDISFSVYLIHMYVWDYIQKNWVIENSVLKFLVPMLVVVVLAKLLHRFYEVPFRNLGRALIKAKHLAFYSKS